MELEGGVAKMLLPAARSLLCPVERFVQQPYPMFESRMYESLYLPTVNGILHVAIQESGNNIKLDNPQLLGDGKCE